MAKKTRRKPPSDPIPIRARRDLRGVTVRFRGRKMRFSRDYDLAQDTSRALTHPCPDWNRKPDPAPLLQTANILRGRVRIGKRHEASRRGCIAPPGKQTSGRMLGVGWIHYLGPGPWLATSAEHARPTAIAGRDSVVLPVPFRPSTVQIHVENGLTRLLRWTLRKAGQ